MFNLFTRPKNAFSVADISIEQILADKKTFDSIVYTPVNEAVRELKKRWKDDELAAHIDEYVGGNIPEALKKSYRLILHRQLMTPNYEVLRFISIADGLNIQPLFFEYHKDKFVTENEWKYYLGCLSFYFGKGKKGGEKIQRRKIIDFNKSNGKPLDEIMTHWGERLIDFHHDLFLKKFIGFDFHIFDGSLWYEQQGGSAKEYYKSFVALLVRNGILFENFVLRGDEMTFTKEIFLPAFLEVWRRTGKKPLVVALEPTDIESETFWVCHPPETMNSIAEKISHKLVS